jgi:hypothetical protein
MKLKAALVVPLAALTLGLGMAAAGPMGSANAQQEQIFGRELMTEQERNELRAKMRSATSEEEREQIRWENHIKMQERAKARGIDLPEAPMLGMRQGRGGGPGQLRLPKGGGRRGG